MIDERMDRQNVIQVDNETQSSASRITLDGRTITYQLKVIQQPVRARACGQGAKSSADRRPVDPPPIVELRIFEGPQEPSTENDITFTMNANYFLFATLEHARPIAQGRMSQDRNNPPVLTGTPVAGMVYLDRPKQAGYFIFPDLSVRHEGKYRLSFSLFEELKNARDEDKDSDDSKPNAAGDAHVSNRLEVKSAPFHVYSAKKFPGLTESTVLSRVVAEQGCRVRIRRDVRMRRRDTKGGSKDWDDYEDQTAQDRARMSATPDPNMFPPGVHTSQAFVEPISRPRSASNASHPSLGPPLSRRTSMQDVPQAYHQQPHYGAEPQTPQNAYSQSFGTSPTQAYATMPYAQQPTMQPPPPQYPQGYSAPIPPAAQNGAPQQYYGYMPAPAPAVQPSQSQYSVPPQPSYEAGPSSHRSSVDYTSQPQGDYRRGSVQQPALPPPPKPQSSYGQDAYAYPSQGNPSQQVYQQGPPPPAPAQTSQTYSNGADFYRPPPMEPAPPHTRPNATTPMGGRNFDLPPLQTTASMLASNKLEVSSPGSTASQNSFYGATQTPIDSHKRSFGSVFSDRHQAQPLRQGARPSSSTLATGASLSAADDDDAGPELDPDTIGMNYRRADGRQIRRALPGHI